MVQPVVRKIEAKAPARPVWRIELDVSGCLTSVRQQLAKLRVPFSKGHSALPSSGEPQEPLATLARLVALLKEHRGRLKLRLVGHCELGERSGLDLERADAAFSWLSEAGISPGILRVDGVNLGDGCGGRCVVPQAVQELVPLYGPITPELAAASAPVGLYFEAKSAAPGQEAMAILTEMAAWLQDEDAAVVVEGHTDRNESVELSSRRAHATREILVRLGVSPKRVLTESCGAAYPLSRQHNAPNRRVELHVQRP